MLDGSTQAVTGTWTHSDTAGLCKYACNDGYTWNGTMCAANPCVAPRTISKVVTNDGTYDFKLLTTLQSGDERSIISEVRTIDGGTIKATESFVCDRGSISEKPETFTVATPTCDAHYSVLGYTCDPETKTYSCVAASRPDHSEWTGLAGYGQTWNGDVFAPVDSEPTYGESAVAGECTYKCSDGYHWNSGATSCDADIISCTPPTGATSATQTWNGGTYGACIATACSSNYTLGG